MSCRSRTAVQWVRWPRHSAGHLSAGIQFFYTLEALGAEGRISSDVFVAIHRMKIDLTQEKVFFEWAESNGLDRKNVEEVYGSSAVTDKVTCAKFLAQAYGIDQVPLMIVDGKFSTEPHRVGSFGVMRGGP